MDKFSTNEYFKKLNAYFDAVNYVSAGQLYLQDNPLLERKLEREDIKARIVGHWGTVPGQNFVYVHCDRVITKYDLCMMLISGPGHGGNFYIANSYLEGVYSQVYPEITYDREGLKKLFKQFSFPGGVSSHVSPEVPGSIHEGGELGYSLAHAFGAVLDNPDLIATVIVGDGEAETGPLATSWHLNKFINPATDGVVLPILHLNGYKISNPTVLSRISNDELLDLFRGYGYQPIVVAGDNPISMHRSMAKAMDKCIESIMRIKQSAQRPSYHRQPFPMIILRTPKGWTGPKVVDGKQIEGSFRAHQVPVDMSKPEHVAIVEQWLRSYHPEQLFVNGKLRQDLQDILPKGDKRISANPNANGGLLRKDLNLPLTTESATLLKSRGADYAQDMLVLGDYLGKVYERNPHNFRIFGPDEAMSNRLYHVFDNQTRAFDANILPTDEYESRSGRVMDAFLSEHACEGMLEGYLLTGRHGLIHSYEAFMRIIDSMVGQHAKWLKICSQLDWRADISSLNIILTSTVWQQDHNGYTHQDPGFLDQICNKKPNIVRIYLPPDANTLLCVAYHCLETKNRINTIVASKHPTPQWLTIKEARQHFKNGVSIWDWACTGDPNNPDIVIASAGSSPTLEALACVKVLHELLPEISIRFVNVVDLMRLVSPQYHPHGLSDEDFQAIFTRDKPVLFNFHGYPHLIHELIHKRPNNDNFHVRGYIEEGTITTPFDMRVQNGTDRFSLVLLALKYLSIPSARKGHIRRIMEQKLQQHHDYIREHGVDMPEITQWHW